MHAPRVWLTIPVYIYLDDCIRLYTKYQRSVICLVNRHIISESDRQRFNLKSKLGLVFSTRFYFLLTSRHSMSLGAGYKGVFAIILVSIQVGIQPFLTEKFVPKNCVKTSVVLLQETMKLFCCSFLLVSSGKFHPESWSLKNSLRVALLPACIYIVQNVFAYYAV